MYMRRPRLRKKLIPGLYKYPGHKVYDTRLFQKLMSAFVDRAPKVEFLKISNFATKIWSVFFGLIVKMRM